MQEAAMKRLIFLLFSFALLLPEPLFANTQKVYVEWSFDYQPTENKVLQGFRLYKEGIQICETDNPEAKFMDCKFTSEDGIYKFTLTAVCEDGTENLHSDFYKFTLGNPLQAIVQSTPTELTGKAPFSVLLDASHTTGNIISYAWSFGDGETGEGNIVEHTYMSAGIYTATLTITNETQQNISKSITITVNDSVETGTPPTAVISSSTAVGQTPLNVTFDGSRSTRGTLPIISYEWRFGDGSSATGQSTNHTFDTSGTFHTSLTITDQQGLSSEISIPVILTQGTVTKNQPPVAALSVMPNQGTAHPSFLFNASLSNDPDGEIISYNWNFGDGSSDTGAIAEHIYTVQADYVATLTITDNNGATATAFTAISTQTDIPQPKFRIELGEVEIDHNWVRIQFDSTFNQPVVVAGPPSSTDNQPCVIRMRNIDTTGFEIRLQEWDYLDGTHPKETVSYMVMEYGKFILEDGSHVQAGMFPGSMNSQQTNFSQDFDNAPVVVTSLATFNEPAPVTGRISNISTTEFTYKMQEQELNSNSHSAEIINFIAWEPGTGNLDNLSYEVALSDNAVMTSWYQVDFTNESTTKPIFLAGMQTTDGRDTAALRYQDLQPNNVQFKVEEEQSNDDETSHTTEAIGYIVVSEKTVFSPDDNNAEINYAINFQPKNAVVPEDFTPDNGGAYNATDGFGWIVAPAIKMARDRNSDLSPDQSYDTTLPAKKDAVWQIDLPNGQYLVDITIGEAGWHPGGQYLQINGEPVVTNFYPNNDTSWLTKQIAVDIQNRTLMLTFEQTNYTQLNWIKIQSIGLD